MVILQLVYLQKVYYILVKYNVISTAVKFFALQQPKLRCIEQKFFEKVFGIPKILQF